MKKTLAILCATACIAGVMAPVAEAAPTVTIKKDALASLPAIWKSVPAAKRLQYLRAAELDATRILAERIMGISLDGETTVKDLAAADDTVKGTVAATLKGVKTVGSPTYHEDGRVEVIRAVKTRTLVESVITHLTGKKGVSVVRETITEEIDALGNAAIPGSTGHARVMAKRAGELDVYRRLSERVAGVQITADSTIKDFAVESDEIKAAFSNTVKSAEITGISYLEDNSAEVTATLKVGPLVSLITKTVSAKGKVLSTTVKQEQLVLEETGVGAPPTPGAKSSAAATAPTTTEIDLIISTTLSSETSL
ncbi:MAG: hypothetical protein IKV82_00240 [Akkermansia sp.]|nr:hypothetical protein [Akkermansia sp.]